MAIPIQFEMQCFNYKQQRKQLNNKVPYNTKLTEKNELNMKIQHDNKLQRNAKITSSKLNMS